MRLLLDEHYPDEIASQLRAERHDATTVSERRLKGVGDEDLLPLASVEDRALLTNNARDFLPITSMWALSGRDHCGLLLTADSSMPRSRDNIGSYVKTLRALLEQNPGRRALENQIRWLP